MQSDNYRNLTGRRSKTRAAWLTLVCSLTPFAGAAAATPDISVDTALVRVPQKELAGKGITTPFDMNEMTPFIDGMEGTMPKAFHKLIFKNQLLVDIVETSGIGVHFPNHPDDELVLVKAGSVTMTTDATGISKTIHAGEWVVIQKGWVGWWRGSPGEYRELAVAASKFYNESSPTGIRDLSPIAVRPSTTAGIKTVYTGNVVVEEHNLSKTKRPIDQDSDEVIEVISGLLTLKSSAKLDRFKAGDVVVIPKGFKGELQVSDGYHALVVSVPKAGH